MKHLLLILFPALLSAQQVTIYELDMIAVTDSTYQFSLERRNARGQGTSSETDVLDSLTAANYAYNITLDGTTFPDGARILGARTLAQMHRRMALIRLNERVWIQAVGIYQTVTGENYDTTTAASAIGQELVGQYTLQTPSTLESTVNLSLFRAPSGVMAYRALANPPTRLTANSGKVVILSEDLIEIRGLLTFDPIRLVRLWDGGPRWATIDGLFTLIKL